MGEKTQEFENKLHDLVEAQGLSGTDIQTVWEQGNPAKKIIKVCEQNNVDLLIAGALKTEGFFKYYIGSIARKIIRKSKCSVLVLIEPMLKPEPFERVVINGTQQEQTPFVIDQGLKWCKADKARQVYIANEIKMYGLQMATASEGGEDEIAATRRKLVSEEIIYVENILKNLDKGDLKISIKITCGKWAIELARFATDVKADLLIVGDEGNLGIFHRIFPHDLEEILSDLPCNLLIVKK